MSEVERNKRRKDEEASPGCTYGLDPENTNDDGNKRERQRERERGRGTAKSKKERALKSS